MRWLAAGLILAALIVLGLGPAFAEPKPQGPMQICTAQWLALRDSGHDAGDLHGQTYPSFIRLCIQGKTADWTPSAAKSVRIDKASVAGRPAKMTSQGNRMKQCGARWRAMKAAGATGGQTWRSFSSQCLRKSYKF